MPGEVLKELIFLLEGPAGAAALVGSVEVWEGRRVADAALELKAARIWGAESLYNGAERVVAQWEGAGEWFDVFVDDVWVGRTTCRSFVTPAVEGARRVRVVGGGAGVRSEGCLVFH